MQKIHILAFSRTKRNSCVHAKCGHNHYSLSIMHFSANLQFI